MWKTGLVDKESHALREITGQSTRCVTRVFVRVTLNYSGAGRLQQGRLIDFTSKHSGGIT